MTGQDIYARICDVEFTKLVQQFVGKVNNPESQLVGVAILTRDMDMIERSDSFKELEEKVLKMADENGQYAGMEYDPDEFLPVEDADHVPADNGLPWAHFGDIWEAFCDMARDIAAEDAAKEARNARSDEPEEYSIPVGRTGFASRTIKVMAHSQKEAEMIALDEAGDYDYSEHDADYVIL